MVHVITMKLLRRNLSGMYEKKNHFVSEESDWLEADHWLFTKRDRRLEHGNVVNKSSWWSKRRFEPRTSGLEGSSSNHSATLPLSKRIYMEL